nr:PREDICTED: SH2 domain-containing adapter protein D isoform X1 [Lepisosteus oculatus]
MESGRVLCPDLRLSDPHWDGGFIVPVGCFSALTVSLLQLVKPGAEQWTAPQQESHQPFCRVSVWTRPSLSSLAELQRGPGAGRSRGGVQLYDTPYDERRRGRGADPEGARESRLPQDDERPADEYDQPWEWKKDHISKAFAVQFDGADWERSSPSPDRLRPPRCSPLGGGGTKFRKASEPPMLLGERVDPTLPLEKQVWYHGAISRSEAEALLTLCKECSYLVRNSQTCRADYSLSLRSCQGFMHMKFTLSKEGKYILGQNSPPFDTIPEVINYYTTHKLPIKGAEHLSLLFPVLVQTL